MAEINVGDVVKLKSGGPHMTVSEISEKDVEAKCVWLFDGGKLEEKWFALAVLKVVPPVQKITRFR